MGNQLNVKLVGEKIVMPDSSPAIDPYNYLATYSDVNTKHTIPEDGYLIMKISASGHSRYLRLFNGESTSNYVDIIYYGQTSGQVCIPVFVKKGQDIYVGSNGGNASYSALLYGVKY